MVRFFEELYENKQIMWKKREIIDIKGMVFGKLTVLEFSKMTVQGAAVWKCQCECGKIVDKVGVLLRAGKIKSCGCSRMENMLKAITKHGEARKGLMTKERISWGSMRARCFNSNNIAYSNYGGRGITVCQRWANSFENFLKDMGR
ncbi:MAG TPA: hypothetical protein VGZ90_13235, partial [Puia sp.]|nr:hypothetical protein [Puia sp.]